jgi:hypothetical protein
MRAALLLAFPVLSLLPSCNTHAQKPADPASWTNAFWYWHNFSDEPLADGPSVDALYVHVGSMHLFDLPHYPKRWRANGSMPENPPRAHKYWVVLRAESPGIPAPEILADIEEVIGSIRNWAARRSIPIAGLQLDVDNPTASLPEYAQFLSRVRRLLPPEWKLSITALLDWFRPSTSVARVIAQIDEFVPQFYDVGKAGGVPGSSNFIAHPVDAARWGPVFNRFGKPFRIGVSTFGRSRTLAPATQSPHAYYSNVSNLSPIQIAGHPGFTQQNKSTPAGELILNFVARKESNISYYTIPAGHTIQYTFATPDSVRAAVNAARAMGGHVSGVIFFRWPTQDETLTLSPTEVLQSLTSRPASQSFNYRIETVRGDCAAVYCADLYFIGASPFSPTPLQFRIRASLPFEYFLPEPLTPVRPAGPNLLELRFPPYTARGTLYLGRAVLDRPAEFTVESFPSPEAP